MKQGATHTIAALAVATGIAPTALMDTPTSVLFAMIRILNEQHKKARQQRGARR